MKKISRRFRRYLSSPLLYLEWLVTVFLGGVGITANFTGLFPLFHDHEIAYLTLSVLLFGLINLWLVSAVAAYKIRYRRAQRAYAIIHLVAEEARNLRDDRRNRDSCRRAIDAICFNYLERLLHDFVGMSPNITLKYIHQEKLHPVRSKNQQGRPTAPEPADENEVFEKMGRHMDKFGAIYIRDVHDHDELQHTFGVDCERLRQRAEGKYRTFIAIPLRWSQYGDGQLPMKGTIGMLGIDTLRPRSFEDLEEEDFQALYAVVDILSECVLYWQECIGGGNEST